MADRVFVSPGVYTSERDLTFVTRQVGVTTLGLVGETTKGPAFQPIFVSNYDEFQSFFGGLNATKIKDNGAPKYELPYIAKSYLSQSNQLFVSRVLGFSGYDSGLSWGITLDGALDEETVLESSVDVPYTINFNADLENNILTITSDNVLIQELWDEGLLDEELNFLMTVTGGESTIVPLTYKKTGSTFLGSEFSLIVDTITIVSATEVTGTVSGLATEYTGEAYSDVENKVVALLRSRGSVDSDEIVNFEIENVNDLTFGTTITDALTSSTGNFELNGTSSKSGNFSYSLSLNNNKKNYITKVLGRNAFDGKTSLFVEEIYENMFNDLNSLNKIRGIKIDSLINYNTSFNDYKTIYQPAVTPWVVSELRGTNLLRLFRLWTISDGNAANSQFKISIRNINISTLEFDVEIRAYGDTDAKPVYLERFSRCTMDPTDNNYIAKKIGTLDGEYAAISSYVLVELEEESDTSEAFPAGVLGYPIRNYQENGNDTVVNPSIEYKTSYGPFENKRKFYLR